MTKQYQRIASPQLFGLFCIAELLLLVILKLVQAFCPIHVAEIFPMFSAILLNALFMLYLVIRVKK